MTASETRSHRAIQVQFLYSLAILLSVPLQLFPAVRIMENGIFERSGKQSVLVKWQKNFFRFCCVVFCAALSYFGAADLDKFVSFVGSFAWYVIPLHAFFYLYQYPDASSLACAVYRFATFTRRCCTTRRAHVHASRRWRISRS